jgi:hypothetical protein
MSATRGTGPLAGGTGASSMCRVRMSPRSLVSAHEPQNPRKSSLLGRRWQRENRSRRSARLLSKSASCELAERVGVFQIPSGIRTFSGAFAPTIGRPYVYCFRRLSSVFVCSTLFASLADRMSHEMSHSGGSRPRCALPLFGSDSP